MKIKTLVTVATLSASIGLSTTAHAGATNIVLDCRTVDGKVALSGDVPGDIADFSLEGRLQKTTVKLKSAWDPNSNERPEAGRVTVVQDFDHGVFTVQAESTGSKGYAMIQLYAFPKSVKKQLLPYGYEAHFNGQMSVNDGRDSEDAKVSCKALYSL